MSTGLIVVGVLTLLLWVGGYIPFLCFQLLRFWNFRHDVTLSKRYPNITVYTVITVIVWILTLTLEVIRILFGGPAALDFVFDILNIIIGFVFAGLLLWRFWLSYYDIQFSVCLSSRDWQKFIDIDAQYDNWYFQRKHTWGDYVWTRRVFVIGTLVLIVFFTAISFFSFLGPIRFLIAIAPFVVILVIYCKTPSFYDEFKITQEMKRVTLAYGCYVGLQVPLALIAFLVADHRHVSLINAVLFALVVNCGAGVLFFIAYTMTFWVLQSVDVGFDDDGNRLRAPLNPWRGGKRHRRERSNPSKASASSHNGGGGGGDSRQMDSKSDTDQSSTLDNGGEKKKAAAAVQARVSLSLMFSDLKYLHELFGHLAREFSMEMLLCYIEVVQLQQYVLLHMAQYKHLYHRQFAQLSGGALKNNIAGLPAGTPRSSIVYADREERVEQLLALNTSGRIVNVAEREQVRVRLISHDLYRKYAAIGSEWEINISYETRGRLTAQLHNFEQWMSAQKQQQRVSMADLALLFEDCKQEMYRLLRHSFARFKRSEYFEKIKSYHQEQVELQKQRENEAEAEATAAATKASAATKKAAANKASKNKDQYLKLESDAEENSGLQPTHVLKPSIEEEDMVVDADDILRDIHSNPDNE